MYKQTCPQVVLGGHKFDNNGVDEEGIPLLLVTLMRVGVVGVQQHWHFF